MSSGKYRSVYLRGVPIFVENRETYKYTFVSANIKGERPEFFKENECSEMHLYKVLLPDDTTKFVLACDESSAISQATCELQHENRQELEKRCLALRVPLRIQGWGTEEL